MNNCLVKDDCVETLVVSQDGTISGQAASLQALDGMEILINELKEFEQTVNHVEGEM